MKKGRHRRYEEARALKRGPDLDIEAIFTDLESDRPAPVIEPIDDVEAPFDGVDSDDPDLEEIDDFDDVVSDDSERDRG